MIVFGFLFLSRPFFSVLEAAVQVTAGLFPGETFHKVRETESDRGKGRN